MKCSNVAIKNPTFPPERSLGHVAYKILAASILLLVFRRAPATSSRNPPLDGLLRPFHSTTLEQPIYIRM